MDSTFPAASSCRSTGRRCARSRAASVRGGQPGGDRCQLAARKGGQPGAVRRRGVAAGAARLSRRAARGRLPHDPLRDLPLLAQDAAVAGRRARLRACHAGVQRRRADRHPHGRAHRQSGQGLLRRRLVRAESIFRAARSTSISTWRARWRRRPGSTSPACRAIRTTTRCRAQTGTVIFRRYFLPQPAEEIAAAIRDFRGGRARARNRGAGDHPERRRSARRRHALHGDADCLAFFAGAGAV